MSTAVVTILYGGNSFGVLPHCVGDGFIHGGFETIGSGDTGHSSGAIFSGPTQINGRDIGALSNATNMYPILNLTAGFVFMIVGTVTRTEITSIDYSDNGGAHHLDASAATFNNTTYPGFSYWCWPMTLSGHSDAGVFTITYSPPVSISVYGKCAFSGQNASGTIPSQAPASLGAFPPVMIANAGTIKPKIYMPQDAITVKA